MMRSLNPCPENFDQNIVDWDNLLRQRGGGNNLLDKIGTLDLLDEIGSA